MLRLRPLAVFLALVFALCLLGLWGARSQTGGLRRVTNTTDEGININPSLSGDGRRISFESTEDLAHAGGSDRFRAIRADLASDPAVFTQMVAARAPAPGISQDGSRIAFAAKEDPLGTNADGNSEIFLYDGATLRQITNTTPNDISTRTRDGNFQPSLTDDGRFIAFSSNRNLSTQNADGNLEIFIFDTTSNTFTQLTNATGPVGASDAKISGDGTRVAYIRDNNASPGTQRDLILQDRTGGTTRLLAANITNLAFTYGRAISDDGLRIVYSADIATDSSQVFLFDGRITNATRQITALGVRTTEVPLHPTISGDGTRIAFATRRPIAGFSNSDNSIELYTYDIPTGQFARVTSAPSTSDGFSGSSRVAEVVSSLNDDGSIVAFNFPRTLSGPVAPNLNLENNSEIYVTGTAARPTTGSLTILNEASFGHEPSTTKAIAPDSNAVALGGALSFVTQQAPKENNTFPTTFGGTTVTVNGRRAQITFVSPTQVNFIVPGQTELGTAEVVVTNEEGFQSRGTVTILRAAPGIFTKSGDGQGEGVVLNANLQGSSIFDPSDGQLRLIIFTTGVRHASQVSATAGGRALTVESYMASPDMPGMDEVHVLVPADLRGAGTVNLVVRTDNNRDSNPVTIIFAGNACRDIVINEVLADPPGSASTDLQGDANHDGSRDSNDDEFVELVNTTANDKDISGYQLLTRSTSATSDTLRHTFAPGTIFPAGSAIVVFGGGNSNFNPNNPVFGGAQVFKTSSSGGLSLTNSGGVVTLREPSQSIVNIFSYGGSTGLNGDANQSLTRSPDAEAGVCGNFTLHSTAPGSNGSLFSPGTKLNGSPFAPGLGRLTSITISPPSSSVAVGQTTQFTAQARDQFNRPITNVTITFVSDNTNVATVDAVTMDATTGIATATVTGRNQGTAHITAQATDGTTTVTSSQATLTVNPLPAVVTRVEVSPANATINRGQTQQFTATAFDQNNQPIAGATFTWTSSDTNVATINSSGLASGVGVGSVTITATTPDATGAMISGTAGLNVQVPLVINEINADVPADNVSTPAIEGDSNRDGVRDSDDDEFVELLNNSNAPVDISGVIIADATSNRFTVPANTTLAAGRALVVFGGGTPPVNDPAFGGALILTTGSLSLNDTGDTVNVKLNFGGADHSIASVTYGGTGNPVAPSDQSLTRSPDAEIGTTGGSFVAHNTATNAAGRTFSPGTRADGTPFGSPAITRIEVSPASATIDVGATQAFTARAFSNTGGPEVEVQNVSFIWDSSDTTKATVAPTTGLSTTAKGVASGNNIIIRARAGAQQGNATLTVNAPAATFTVTGQVKDSSNNPLSGVLITFDLNFQGTLSTKTTLTDANGNYSSGDLGCQNNVKVTPSKTGFTFTPSAIAFVNSSQCLNGSEIANFTATLSSPPASSTVVISQIYGGGGNSGAPLNADFIELFNRGSSPVDITGWSVQYASGSGTTGNFSVTPLCPTGTCSIPAGGYFLVKEAGGATGSAFTSDVTGNIAMAATAGRVALVTNTTPLSAGAACPALLSGTVDFVGYGSASCFEGSGPTSAPSNTTAVLRKSGGCVDTNNNAADFLVGAPSPRNSSSPLNDCNAAATPNISINDVAKNEGNAGTTTFTFTVSLSAPAPASGVTFNIATQDGTATIADNDYVAKSLTGQTIAAGQQTYTFDVTVNGDTNVEPDETFFVNITNVTGATLTDGQGLGTILSDDIPSLSINDVSVAEGNSGTKTVDFTVTLSASSTQTVTVGYATSSASPATATADTDYQSTSGTLTFNPGETSKPITITIKGDTLVEPDETFFVNLSGATNASILDGQGQGTITNDDTANLVISQVYGGGGNTSATYTNDFVEIFNRGTTTVNFAVTPYSIQYAGAASNFGSNLTTINSGTIAPGQYFLVQEFAPSSPAGVALPAPDASGSINLATSGGKVALVSGVAPVSATACPGDDLSTTPLNPTGNNIVDFEGYGSGATCYEGTGPTLAHANTTADFRKAGGCTDTDDNAADFFVHTPIPRNSGSPLNSCSAGVTPNLTINDVTVVEGNAGTATATFTVSLSTPAQGADVTFDIATADGTATVANNDYVTKSLTNQIIPAGQQTYTFTVNINGDTTVEADETFFVNVTNVVGANLTDGQGVGTIQNDDLPSLSINDVSHSEGNMGTTTYTFTVSLSSPAPATVTFDIATADGTAQDGTPAGEDNDYVARSLTSQTIAAGSQTYTFDVIVNGDTNNEPTENFFVNVTNVSGATVADSQGQGTIQNDDAPPSVVAVVVSPSSPTINRGQTQQFTATAFDPSNQPVAGATFTWSSSNTNVATIDSSGLATGVGIGTTTITATTSDGIGGNVSGTATLTVQVPLVINEIHADVVADNAATTDVIEGDANRDGVRDSDDDEFVELLNNSSAPVDISGVVITDLQNAATSRFTFQAGTTLAAGRAVVVFGGGNPPVNDPAFGGALVLTVANSATSSSTLSLNDTGDTVTVKLNVGGTDVQIAQVVYGGTGNAIAPSDQSLTRSPDAEIGTTGGNFVAHNTATNAAGRTFSPGTRADGTPFGSPAITRIDVAPASASVNIGATQSFTATAYSNVGGPEVVVPNVSFIWDSSDTSKATVAPTTGQSTNAKGVAAGSSTIRARAGGQQGTATLSVNAPLTLSINDVTHNEGNTGTTTYTFTVSLSATAPAGGVTFDIATQDNTATVADNDYVARSLVNQTITSGNQTYTFDVTVNGDTAVEPNESFFVNVTNVTGATVTDGQGVGTITNDDSAAPALPAAGQVIINEALVASSTTSTTRPDFLELYNTTNQTLDISGMIISFRPGGTGNIPSTVTLPGAVGSGTTTIAANSYFIIVNGASVLSGSGVTVAADYNPGAGNFDLNGTGGGIKIEVNGVKLDGLTYQGSATAINATFVAYGEGSIFTFTSATTNDLVRSSTSADTNNNASDFRHLSSSTTITPKAANPP